MTQFTFKKKERLKSRKTIGRLFAGGQSFGMYPLRLVFLKEEEPKSGTPVEFGVSVPKRSFKSAVARNRLKRKVREAWRLNKHQLYQRLAGKPWQYAFMVIYVAKEDLTYEVIEKAMQAMIRWFIKKNVPPHANPPEGPRPLS
ncbi:MAG: ribonuclease P protein component [Saprospiraceae bacterium]|nr:MAG: ribonuclease P protein component [Saprospiraceae bacterium]